MWYSWEISQPASQQTVQESDHTQEEWNITSVVSIFGTGIEACQRIKWF
jgi:hypothetical protein